MTQFAAWLLILGLLVTGCSADERVVVAAGTTLVDSGFINRVLEQYPADTQVSVVGVSSLEALALGSSGSAEVLITHLPEAETAFLADHPSANQEWIFASQFVLVGPESERLEVSDAVELVALIGEEGLPFVSRADGSGTAAKEQDLWELAGIDPMGQLWYIETGQGMGFTLQVADQRNAFALAEIGSYLAAEPVALVPFVSGDEDERLRNPYRVTLVPGASDSATDLFDWLTSAEGAAAIVEANLELFDELIYSPTLPS